jgi:hypothetical protein
MKIDLLFVQIALVFLPGLIWAGLDSRYALKSSPSVPAGGAKFMRNDRNFRARWLFQTGGGLYPQGRKQHSDIAGSNAARAACSYAAAAVALTRGKRHDRPDARRRSETVGRSRL